MISVNEIKSYNFVYNDSKRGVKVLRSLQKEMEDCLSFDFSVAFITMGGFIVLANQLKELREKGIKGRLITSIYNEFNDPKIFRKLLEFENLEVKIYTNEPLHTKGYLFYKNDHTSLIIGSSNLTQSALTVNKEWNLKLDDFSDSLVVNSVKTEFEKLWTNSEKLTEEWIKDYESGRIINNFTLPSGIYEKASEKVLGNIKETSGLLFLDEKNEVSNQPELQLKIQPNSMQKEALKKLKEMRGRNCNKALIISATGTGKTYLAALDVYNFKAKKVLFVIHREQIARDALNSFSNVVKGRTFGIFSGNSKEIEKDIIFTTVQTISKEVNHKLFDKNHFDYIIIDEAHRSGAESYKRILEYFEPEFLLGMTATPERTDGFNIFELFDNNIAYEIRLKHALEEDMLTPFHYFGVTEVTIDGEVVDEQTSISKLLSKHRVDYIVDQIKYYGYSGDRVKGLIFCSRNEEAEGLSQALNQRGFRTISLSGKDSQEFRESSIKRLESEDGDLDYIITVDIFNEGIDIPEINQIVMLRPTQSAIIFVQQMGRGLRKTPNKEFVVIIDFIGNYKNNFMIPIALSGDRTMNKNNLREFMIEGNDTMPGSSTFEFDTITKEVIYKAINNANLSSFALLKNDYNNLKYRLNRVPSLIDYRNHEIGSPEVIFENKSFFNYHDFLSKVENNWDYKLSEFESEILSLVSLEFIQGKRDIEIEIIKQLMTNKKVDLTYLKSLYGDRATESALRVLSTEFYTQEEKKKYSKINLFNLDKNALNISSKFNEALENKYFVKMLKDVIDYSFLNYKENIEYKTDQYGFVIGNQYTRKDASWLLNWKSNQQATIYGYKIDRDTNTMPIFVTYHKSDEVDDSINYNDEFISPEIFSWMSKNKRTVQSEEIQRIINSSKEGLKILLNVKREDGESKYFYYLGEVEVVDYNQTTIISKGKELPIVNFKFKLKNPVRQDLYDYITSK